MPKVRHQRAETLEARDREVELLRVRPSAARREYLRPMANTAAPHRRQRSVPTRRLRVRSPPPRALPQAASSRYPAPRQSRRHAPCRARCRPERGSVQPTRVLGRTADATPGGAFRFRSGRTPPKVAMRAAILRRPEDEGNEPASQGKKRRRIEAPWKDRDCTEAADS